MKSSSEAESSDPQRVPPPSTSAGKKLGKYRILRKLGRGGMGIVYEAEDTLLQRPVAIKVLSSTVAKNPDALQRFLREARATAKLVHPHVVAIHEIDQRDGLWYIAMELIAGGSVEAYLTERLALPWQEATQLTAEACTGLIAAHAVGLVHRDIKPANLMRTLEGRVKLVDFGLAKASEETSALTATGTVVGTPHFMSPEQWRAEPLDDLSDIYSLGATYYAMLTGRPPYAHREPLQVMYACCSEPSPDPRSINASVPPRCAAIILKAMAKDPSARYASASAMLADLQAALENMELPAETEMPPVIPPATSAAKTEEVRVAPTLEFLVPAGSATLPRRRRTWLITISVVAVLVLVAFLWRQFGRGQPDASTSAADNPSLTTAAATDAPQGDWQPLFNGQNLDGWWKLKSPPGEWVVEEELLIGRAHPHPTDSSSYLFTIRNDFANFHCRAEVRINAVANSGLFFRCTSDASLPEGLEAHLGTLDCGDLHHTGSHGPSPVSATESPIAIPPNVWVNLEVVADGPHVIVKVNDQITAESTEHAESPSRGYIALQVFEPGTEVAVRKLEIRELP